MKDPWSAPTRGSAPQKQPFFDCELATTGTNCPAERSFTRIRKDVNMKQIGICRLLISQEKGCSPHLGLSDLFESWPDPRFERQDQPTCLLAGAEAGWLRLCRIWLLCSRITAIASRIPIPPNTANAKRAIKRTGIGYLPPIYAYSPRRWAPTP
jgi:hypothetical protein